MSGAVQHLTCIVCPLGCQLVVTTQSEGTVEVSGNRCRRGMEYGRMEVTDPRRVLTTTVALRGAALRRLPVKTSRPVPKQLVLEAAAALRQVEVAAPVRVGDVVVADLLGTGIPVVATRDVSAASVQAIREEVTPSEERILNRRQFQKEGAMGR